MKLSTEIQEKIDKAAESLENLAKARTVGAKDKKKKDLVKNDETKGAEVKKSSKEKIQDLIKAGKGAGSRGGKVIGITRSGKPVYAKRSAASYKNFSTDDHRDASAIHYYYVSQHISRGYEHDPDYGGKNKKESDKQHKMAEHHRSASNDHEAASGDKDFDPKEHLEDYGAELKFKKSQEEPEMKELLQTLNQLGPDGVKKALDRLTESQQELLGKILEENMDKAISLDKLARKDTDKGGEAGSPPQKANEPKVQEMSNDKDGIDAWDESLVPEAAEGATVRHQGGSGDDGAWQGQIIKALQDLKNGFTSEELKELSTDDIKEMVKAYMGFEAVKRQAAAGGAKNPAAVAAAAGRKKYGKKRFNQMISAGKPGGKKGKPAPGKKQTKKALSPEEAAEQVKGPKKLNEVLDDVTPDKKDDVLRELRGQKKDMEKAKSKKEKHPVKTMGEAEEYEKAAPKGVDEAKYKRCKEKVKRQSPNVNEYAVCAASLQGKTKKACMKKSDDTFKEETQDLIKAASLDSMMRRMRERGLDRDKSCAKLSKMGYDMGHLYKTWDSAIEEAKESKKHEQNESKAKEKKEESKAKKMSKSIKWSDYTHGLTASTRSGHNIHYTVENVLLKSEEARTKAKENCGWYQDEAYGLEPLKKSKNIKEADANDLIEKGLDRDEMWMENAGYLKRYETLQKACTIKSFSDDDMDAVLGIPSEDKKKDLSKGGEGSRGGKILGHTQSGKPIYANANHPEHKKWEWYDHMDAASKLQDMHQQLEWKHKQPPKRKKEIQSLKEAKHSHMIAQADKRVEYGKKKYGEDSDYVKDAKKRGARLRSMKLGTAWKN